MNSHLRDILIGSLTNEIAEANDVDRRLVNLLAYTTYQPRAVNAPTESISGFVSNLNNSMMRCRPRIVRLRLHRGGLACNSRLCESQISKLSRASGPDEGQPDNRKLNEPSAMRQIQFNWTRMVELFLSVRPNYNPTWSYLHG